MLRSDGVFAVPGDVPGGHVPRTPTLHEFVTNLLEEDVDALGAVDLTDARQLVMFKISDLDGRPHPGKLPKHER